MKPDKNKESEKQKENRREKTDGWIDKADKFIDDTADKIHKSDAYKKADKSIENATKKLFRKAGRLWGKSKRYLDDKNKKNDN